MFVHDGPPDHNELAEIGVDEARPGWAPAAVGAFVALVACGYISNVVWASWISAHPAGLLALSSRARYLLLVVNNGIDPVPYYLIGFLRLFVAATACYACGWAFRTTVIKWFVLYLGMTKDKVHQMQNGFGQAAWVLVPFFVGSNIVCALAGVDRLPPKRFFSLLSIGIVGRLVLYRIFAESLKGPLDWITKFSGRYTAIIMIVSLLLTVGFISLNVRKGKKEWGDGM